jgi:DNA invertase Pin-like site-specific DNA recombinase
MNTTNKQTAVYVRVSSKSQDTRSQEAELKRWAETQDASIVWYRDKASGKTMDRPGWKRLWADVESGKVARVVVWRLDRLGRTASGLTKLFDDLTSRRIGLFSLKDSLDLETPAGRLMANVLASVASYEREVRGERQRAGIDAARAAGKTWGGSKAGRLLSITSEQANAVRRLAGEGVKRAVIARTVGVSRQSVYRLLSADAVGKI